MFDVTCLLTAAFISVVILCYCRQNSQPKLGEAKVVERGQLAEHNLQQALVVAERKSQDE